MRVITYGTFDIFHEGHINLLQRAKAMGSHLIVGVSDDKFNESKGKKSLFSFNSRVNIVKSCRYVDQVIPEISWDQKIEDIRKYNIDIFVMGDDWTGHFDFITSYCDVRYISRTHGISSSAYKQKMLENKT